MSYLRIPWESAPIDLDEWAVRVVQSNCDMEKGAPYWIEFQRKNNLNLVREIQTWQDLIEKLPNQPEGALHSSSTSFMLTPKHLLKDKIKLHFSQSSGSTTAPKRTLWNTDSLDYSIAGCNHHLKILGAAEGNWIITGPPTLYQKYMERLVKMRAGFSIFVEVPTEGIKPLFETPEEKLTEGQKYYRGRITEDFTKSVNRHLEDRELDARVIIGLPFTMPMLAGMDLSRIDTILCLGAGINEESFKRLKEMFPGKKISLYYSHFMNAVAPLIPSNEGKLRYYPLKPLVNFEVKNPETGETVKMGERGVIEFLRAGEDILWKQWEDAGTREPAPEGNEFPWDGVGSIGRYKPAQLR